MFKKYHQNEPKEIEAVQFTEKNKVQVFNLLTGQCLADTEEGQPVIRITTIHGDIVTVRFGDWIAKEAKDGFYYLINKNLFPALYKETLF